MSDGRVLVGGEIGNAQNPPRRIVTGRFLSDGSPDPTFGGGVPAKPE